MAEQRSNGDDPEYSAEIVAEILGLTTERLGQLSQQGMPRNGRDAYPLKGCVQWYVAFWRDRALGRKDDNNRARKYAAEAQLLEARVKKHAGDLIERGDAAAVWTAAVVRLGKAFETLPNNLAREFNWPPEVVRSLRASLDDFRRTFVRDSAEFVDVIDDQQPSSEKAVG